MSSYKSSTLPLRDHTNLSKKSCTKTRYSRIQKFKLQKSSPKNVKAPQGDLDDASLIIPSPPETMLYKGRSPASRETNETSHEASGHKNGPLDNSDDFLECDENLVPALDPAAEQPKLDTEQDGVEPAGENLSSPIGPETLSYLISREQAYFPDAYYLDKLQPHLTWMMRSILLDWMMEVCAEFHLKRETFHYAANYVDRYLSRAKNVPKTELQLVGVTAMFIAAKMEEVYAPKISDFAKATDDTYAETQIRDMEKVVSRVY